MLDTNQDGSITKSELFNELTGLNIAGIDSKDFDKLFDAFNTNKSLGLSVNELALFLKGAQRTQKEKEAAISFDVQSDMHEKI